MTSKVKGGTSRRLTISPKELRVQGQAARVYHGGTGAPLLLVHGGWGDSRMHWSHVWDDLAKRYEVIAADLPGLGWVEQAPLASVAAYAEWLVAVLDELGVDRAWLVGNSFGASVAWSLAGHFPERCAGLVLVNGVPMPRTPGPLLWCGETRVGRRLVRSLIRRLSYNRRAVRRAFVDPTRVPEEVPELMATAKKEILLRRLADILIAGDGAPPPRTSPLLLWGARDHLPGTSASAARRLRRSMPGSKLKLVRKAGHFPQIEAPQEFIKKLNSFVNAATVT